MTPIQRMDANNRARKAANFLNLFVPQIIAYQDGVTPDEGRDFYKAFNDPQHQDCPHNNSKACPKCRVDDAEQLALILIQSMEDTN